MSRPAASRRMTALAASLHEALETQVLEPLDPRGVERLENLAQVMWTLAQTVAMSPHVCNDRYCACHLVLHEWEPPPLWGDPNGW